MSTACTAATFEGSGCRGTITDGQCSEQDDHHPTPGMLPYDGPGAESADTGQAREPVMTETVRALVRRLSRTRREFAEVMPCTWCNGIGVVPEEAFGRDEDGAPMVDGVRPCPEGCEVPWWLQAERNDAAELDCLRAAVAELEGQLEWSRWAASAAQRGERELIQQRAAGLALAAAAEEQRDADAGEEALVPAAALRRALLGTDTTPDGAS